jgi:hypothetical protein
MKVKHLTTSRLLHLLVLSFLPLILSAQQEEEDLRYLNSQEALLQVASQVGPSVLVPSAQTPENTGVFINQIGDFNRTIVQSSSERSDINLIQTGNENTMRLDLSARNIIYNALQQGNGNKLLEFNSVISGKELIQRDIQQVGNDQNLIIHGNNGLSDRLQVRMSNSGQSLIIRNSN